VYDRLPSAEVSERDQLSLPLLVQGLAADARELALAEVARAKGELRSLAIHTLLVVSVTTAALVVVALALFFLVAVCVLVLGGQPVEALAAASVAMGVLFVTGLLVCLRSLHSLRGGHGAQAKVSDSNAEVA
jgi:uncharacterized membrane protein YqjE